MSCGACFLWRIQICQRRKPGFCGASRLLQASPHGRDACRSVGPRDTGCPTVTHCAPTSRQYCCHRKIASHSCRAQLQMCMCADSAAAPPALLRMSTLARKRRSTPPTTLCTRRCARAKARQAKNQSGTKAVRCKERHRMERARARHRSDCALPIAKPCLQMHIGAIRT
jgi:hypothetical protein